MILILTDKDEPTTDFVIDWLLFQKKKFVRISEEDKVTITKIFFHKGRLEALFTVYNGVIQRKINIDTREIKSYWYRRSVLPIDYYEIESKDSDVSNVLSNLIRQENIEPVRILNHILNSKKRLNSYEDNNILKTFELEVAQKVGLKTPKTIICSNKKDLESFYRENNGRIITKAINSNSAFFEYNYHCHTSRVDLRKIPSCFSLSLVQEEVEKIVELRIFVLNNVFFSSAIFSQLDKHTKVDLKNYDTNTHPNRIVPFNLPQDIQNKLTHFMKELNLNSGSIDMIITPVLEYVFLEINPLGQFEQVAMPCNYNLFKEVANYL